MPSRWCLISALTQAGGGDLLFRFAGSVQSCYGEGGALQADVAVCGEHSPCSGQAASSFGALSPGAVRFSLRGERPGQPEVCRRSPRVCRAFSLRSPSARHRLGLRKSLDRNRGPVCQVGGVASPGLSLPLSPPPCLLPPAGMGRLFSGVSQPLCFANRRRCVPAG